jgi:hypothetical protein
MKFSKPKPSASQRAEDAVLELLTRFPSSRRVLRWKLNAGLPWYRKWTRLTVWLALRRLVRKGLVEYTDVPVVYPNWSRIYYRSGCYDRPGSDGAGAGGEPGDALAVA